MAYEHGHDLPIRPQSRLQQRVKNHLVRVTFQDDLPSGAIVELVIRIDASDVNLREMSAYLELVDRSFGRLTSDGLRSYVQRRPEQLKASFQPGSLEIVIEAVASHEATITALVVLRFLLKYVPVGLKDIATAHREVEEARLTRARRKQLREQADVDEELESLEPKQKSQLVRYFDYVYVRERRVLPAAQRFSRRYVREVFVRVRRRE